ncbi:fibronectin-like [Channa argus]|uniref:fibronectin-like n=1 Tax=Channa argus TaxID=215402 RepID=UPI003521DB6A
MDMYMFYSSVILMSVMQIEYVLGTECTILSVTSPSASTLNVVWTSYQDASVYLLDFRDENATSTAPVVAVQYAPSTQALVQGLRPGHVYQVTLKVLQFYNVVSRCSKTALTVPAASQITLSKPISSTSIKFEWSSVFGADSYILLVEEVTFAQMKPPVFNQTFTNQSAQVNGLTPASVYNSYIYSSNSAGLGAKSSTKTIMTLVQPPTGVNITLTGKSTARVTWNAVNKVLIYQVSVSASPQTGKVPFIRNSSVTFMDITNLAPCSNYTVGVSSLNAFLLPGEPSNVTISTASINPVTTISVDYLCSSGIVTVTWDSVFGASFYIATFFDSTGASRNCTSASTSCQISNVKCGETYQVNVTAISGDCKSNSNTSASFETIPCGPANPETYHDCSSNVIVFGWQPTNNTFYYVAMAVDNAGEMTECVTLDNTCYFTNVDCGQTYNYSVYAVGSECNTDISQPVSVRTSPCLPTNILTEADCASEQVNTMWDTAAGALSYSVEAKGNTGNSYNCSSNFSSCTVTGVPCGESLSVWIIASNEHCSTNMVLGEVAQTAPCRPTNVSVSTDCSQDSAMVNWTSSNGAIFYIAVAQDAYGNMHTCNSGSTNCLITGLRCGQNYTTHVISTNFICNRTSEEAYFRTAPCSPTNIQALRNCDTNEALIVWQNHQPTGLYTAIIEDQEGAQLNCTSNTVNNCNILSPPCGKRFNVTVTHSDGNCLFTSTPISMDSVPCGPKDVGTTVSCVTGELTVTWNTSVATLNYTTIISRGMGSPLQCNSTETQCTTGGLLCGSTYNVTVYSITGTCFSLPSAMVPVQTLPCPPTNIAVSPSCAPDPTPVSWMASNSAKYYNLVAVSSGGYRSECTTNETSCTLPGLQCGDVYTIAVSGADEYCVGEPSNSITLKTEPCIPTNVSSQVSCRAGIAQVSWVPSVNALRYNVKATSNEHILTCTSSSPSCTLSNLICDQAYDIQVSAADDMCVSSHSAPIRQDQVPCVPKNVSASLVCFSYSARVTWVGTTSAVGYNVTMMDQDGNTSFCYTNATSCQVHDIQCGKTYDITVTPYSKTCTGNPSAVYSFDAGLCAPSHVTVSQACDVSTVSWSPVVGADRYIVKATGDDGNTYSCSSNYSSSCNFTGLPCGQNYVVTVQTLDRGCLSEPSPAVNLTTALCAPANLTGQIDSDTNTINLTWDQSPVLGAMYMIKSEVIGATLPPSEYTTLNTSYTLTNLQCGERYTIHVTAQEGNCSRSYKPTLQISTVPCPPENVTVDLLCGSHTAVLSWEQRSNVDLYEATAIKVSVGEVKKCNSTNSTCQFSGLDCGETYNFTVTAHIQGSCSQNSDTVSTETEPCQPLNVSAQVFCQSDTVQISWYQASRVVNYFITATGSLGYMNRYNTTQTLLSASLPCGQDYNVTVQAQGSKCHSISSSPASFKMAPCIPRNVTTSVQCNFNMGSVSWEPSDGAKTYVVVATGLDTHTHQCFTNTTSCTWNDLHCGEEYTVVVSAKDDSCNSLPSSSSIISMHPCKPLNLVVSVNCNMKVVSLSWDASIGTTFYMVSANAGNKTSSLTTNVTAATFSDLACGQNYSLSVTPSSQHCLGTSLATTYVQTWPCPPSGLTTTQDCESATVKVTWQASAGSDYYTANMQTDTGISQMCTSNSNTCSIPGLTCGHNFSVSVTASNQQCNTTSAQTTSLMSVPCVPTDVSIVTGCANNTAVVSWSAGFGAVEYLATARSYHSNVSCQTSDLSCRFDDLTCGSQYTVQVVAVGNNCSSIPSDALMFKSTPCPPQNVSAQVNCLSNDLTISWNGNREADHFLVSINGGFTKLCNTTNTSCSITNVTCGNTITAQVTSVRGDCSSQHSETQSILTAPCQPQGIKGSLDFVTNYARISWDAASGVDSYTVTAVDGTTYSANCTTSSNTTCEVKDLECGLLYNFSVIAKNIQCESRPSAIISLQTASCSPYNITAFPQCDNSSILVVWKLMGGVGNILYKATAEASDHTYLFCYSTGTSCYLQGARCDLSYTIIVVDSADQGGARSSAYSVTMEPCPPSDLTISASCADHTALVSWTPSPIANMYTVVAQSVDGHVYTCNSTSSSCTISMLQCNQQYTVFVTASNENCSSKASQNATFNAGLCPPDGLSVTWFCNNQTALLSWRPIDNAVDYYGYAQDGNGDKLYCHSTNDICTIKGLNCGTIYNFTVQASDGTCNSSFSEPVQRGATPCPPDDVAVQLLPMQMEIQVLHFTWTQISCSDTEYLVELRGSLLGDSQALFNIASYWANMTYFEIPLPCSSSYVATVSSRNAAGTSQPSESLNRTTAPCPPSGVVYQGGTVSWNASVFATTYTVYDNSFTPMPQLCNTSELSCQLPLNTTSTNLVITARNSDGESEAEIIANVVNERRRKRDITEQNPETGGLLAPVLRVIQRTSKVIFVEWSQVDAASHYNLVIRMQGSSTKPRELTVYEEHIILTDLSPNSTYCLSVSAGTSETTGPESEPLCTQTRQGFAL